MVLTLALFLFAFTFARPSLEAGLIRIVLSLGHKYELVKNAVAKGSHFPRMQPMPISFGT